MIETLTKIIGDNEYLVTQMTAMRAIRMQTRLIKLLGPSFAAMMTSDISNTDKCLPMAISLLTDKLDEKQFEQLVLDLTQGVRRNGKEMTKSTMDLDFAGKLNELFLVMQFVLECNFSDFFQEGGFIANLIAENQTVNPPISKNTLMNP